MSLAKSTITDEQFVKVRCSTILKQQVRCTQIHFSDEDA